MEIRARYVLIGLFVLAVIAGGFGFVYWLNNTSGVGPRTTYKIAFDGSVSGLTLGSPVLFNGLAVGEVTSLGLVADTPGRVLVTIAVGADTPVRSDTHVGLDFRGLTGTATVSLAGGTASATFPPGDTPLLVADSASMKDLSAAAREVLGSIDTLISDNRGPITDAIGNIDTFSKALSDNSDKIAGIMKGLAKLAGSDSDESLTNYDLDAPTAFPSLGAIPTAQLALPIPSTVITTDSQRINIQTADGEEPGFPTARWADSVPQLARARIIQGFENAGYLKVGSDDGGVVGDFKLLLDIRRFRISIKPSLVADVAYTAKLIDTTGKVVDARIFTATQPLADVNDTTAAAKALDAAFDKTATDLIVWALQTVDTAAAAAPAPDNTTTPDAPAPDASAPDVPAPDASDMPAPAAPTATDAPPAPTDTPKPKP